MNNNLHVNWVALILSMAVLGACTPSRVAQTEPPTQSNPTSTQFDLATQLARPTTTISPTLTVTSVPTETPIRPTPSLPALVGKDFYFGEIFFAGTDSQGCTLPCWNELVINQSKEDEVLREYEKLVGPADFNRGGLGHLGVETPIPDLYTKGFQYEGIGYEQGIHTTFSGFAAFDVETGILQLLGFAWTSNDTSSFEVHLSPQRAIKELGFPSHMLATRGPLLEQITLLLIWDSGIVFEYVNDLVEFSDPGASIPEIYCFDDTEIQLQGAFIIGNMYILEPFSDGLNDLSPLQDATVGEAIRQERLVSAETFFGMAQDAIITRILQEQDTCITL